ncbi:MAG: helix-turn-helix domain-containing protein [Lachnospiraceae bacterium]|nr:helix-turn-helix domain-containing protein [Lachnospiraceae bacterium]
MYQILRGGCNSRHPSSFVMSRPEGLPCFVLLIIRTHGSFQIDNEHYQVSPGAALILAPGTPYSYSNPDGEYMDDWLHFTVADEEAFIAKLSFINVPLSLENTESYTTLVRQIMLEHSYTPQPYSDENIDALFHVLINHLLIHQQNATQTANIFPYKAQLQSLRLELQNSFLNTPDIKESAASIGISESYFQHLYSELFGISYQQDVIHFRIEYAKNLLLTTELPVEEIAELCGYNNEIHFYRQFKKIAGSTPAKFRKTHVT